MDALDQTPLSKADSTASASKISVKSYVSLPVTGTIPYGNLRVHRASQASPEPSSVESTVMTQSMEINATPAPCLASGDVVLLLDLPDKIMVGHDSCASTVTKKRVYGIRDVPPGPHLLWVSSPDGLFRFGYWYITKAPGRVRLKQWDKFNEFLGEPASQFEAREQRKNIQDTYPQLIPHGYGASPSIRTERPPPPPPKGEDRQAFFPEPDFAATDSLLWHRLTSSISQGYLAKVTGKSQADEWLVETTDAASSDTFTQQTNKLFRVGQESQLHFVFADDITIEEVSSRSATSNELPDLSTRLATMLESEALDVVGSELTAELQFTFLNGMHLGNHACIRQWAHLLLRVILQARTLIVSHPVLGRILLETLHAQMIYNERNLSSEQKDAPPQDAGHGGIFDIIPGTRNKLRYALKTYKRCLNEQLLGLGTRASKEQAAVGHAFDNLEAWFWRHGWDLRGEVRHQNSGANNVPVEDSDEDEYTPVVVHLDDSGKEIGLVSWSGE